jgi:hypothetical protein
MIWSSRTGKQRTSYVVQRLSDSNDLRMHLVVCALILLFDSALTFLIIARVPCALFPKAISA